MKSKTIFKCGNCGYESSKWMGRCTECDQWNTFEEVAIVQTKYATASSSGKKTSVQRKPPVKLSEVTSSNSDRLVTDINEFNRVMGGGIVKDSITIITARPGAGKSTLLLQVADNIASKGCRVVYASGEESESQIKNRADRILKKIDTNIWVISDSSMNSVLSYIDEVDPDLVIVDSIQSFAIEELLPSRAGSPTQTMECANELLKLAKNNVRPRAVIVIGQMTKNDELAGLRALEHLVDTVLLIDGENEEELRGLMASKNRFGSTGEMGFFSMTETGLQSIDNPSEFFMTKRNIGSEVSGSALAVIKEGTRPVIVEIESLVSQSFTPIPSRIGEGLSRDQMNTVISILEQRGKMNLFNKNVVIKANGGLRLREHAANLSIAVSIASSVYDKGIPNDTAFIADIGLTGELKKVPSLEVRIKELDRMGFRRVYVAPNAFSRAVKFSHIKVVECKTIKDVLADVFGGEVRKRRTSTLNE